jgi:hypothetical protein
VDEEDAIDRGIRQRHRKFIDQGGERRTRGRPFQHALRRRHEGDTALGVLAEQAEIRRRIADAEHPLTLNIRPARMNAAIDQPPRHDAEALRIEIAEIDDIDGHALNLTCRGTSRRPDYRIAQSPLTPYFMPI